MLRSSSLLLYFLLLLADILLIAFHAEAYRVATKPLLMLLLVIYALYSNVAIPGAYRSFLLAALLFSSLGDDLLLYDGDRLFLPGLGSFFLAHIAYIVFFLKIRYSNPPVPLCKYPYIFLNAAAAIAFILFLAPYTGSFTWPVILYALAISINVQSTIHAFHFKRQPMAIYCVIGAVLFMISDSLIAFQKFYQPIPGGDMLVMLTYGLAQSGLVYGSVKYFESKG
ncbi:putative membrane protein YhhN [Chitinophaga terrae (ex Kim and Jung 2007)]|uniref:lysoplasmalogenase n=1 Tax=Chitinophaga terrae (ex Kim and Jung 2007) TaxID=408074 RepID=UPI002781A57D|nr:lysoplasmalogenase [Chitinophaga terrae (ex Kim and Jung 2007)]MDQ0105655.1 putative membrane protein YhhN [Chitinophaga terrae (ex Kim and Jung 2007)]